MRKRQSLNFDGMASILFKDHGIPKHFAEDILRTIMSTIVTETEKGNLVRLRNFGTFEMRKSHRKRRLKFSDSENVREYPKTKPKPKTRRRK